MPVKNLAIGFLESQEVQNAWQASPTHEANIVNNKYQENWYCRIPSEFQRKPATIVVQLLALAKKV